MLAPSRGRSWITTLAWGFGEGGGKRWWKAEEGAEHGKGSKGGGEREGVLCEWVGGGDSGLGVQREGGRFQTHIGRQSMHTNARTLRNLQGVTALGSTI